MNTHHINLADLLRVCLHATPHATPIRTLGHQLAPKWFAPREIPPCGHDDMHMHHMYEAQFCLTGRGYLTVERTQAVGPGSVAMYPSRIQHTFQSGEEGNLMLWAGFEVDPPVRVVEPAHWPVWPAIFADLEIMIEESRLNVRGWAERAGLRLSLLLARTLTISEAQPSTPLASMNYDALIHEVDRYCEMYYAQPIRLLDIADYFQLSPRTLMRQFQQRTGETVMAHLHALRLRKAAWLLQHSDLPISEVARACGLQANYFSRAFAARYGVTPSGYRDEVYAADASTTARSIHPTA